MNKNASGSYRPGQNRPKRCSIGGQRRVDEQLTKHGQLKNWIRQRIMNGTYKTGDKLVSENELCKMFGISRHTVRHALDALEREGLLDRRRGSGTYIRKNPENSKTPTKNVGVIMSYLDEYIFPGIIRGVDSVLSPLGYNIVLGITYNKLENEKRLIESCIEKEVDGLIVEATKSALPNPNMELYRSLGRMGIPAVFLNCYYHQMACSYVVMDDRGGGRLAASALIEAGHRKLGGIFKLDDMQGRERYAGFTQALRDHGLSLSEDHVIWYATEDEENYFCGEGDALILKRLAGCTGVVCYNDQIAGKLVALLERNGISVPGNLSIASFDNSDVAVMGRVKLTTVAHAGERMGARAAQNLCYLMRGGEGPVTYTFPAELIRRDSIRRVDCDAGAPTDSGASTDRGRD